MLDTAIKRNTDVIDIKEVFQILSARKKLIWLSTLLFVLVSMMYVFTVKPVYQVQAMIEMGKLEAGTQDEKSLDNVVDIKQKLEYIYGVKSKKKRDLPKVKSIGLNKHAKNVFSIMVEGHSNEDAKAFVDEIIRKIEKEYSDQIASYIDTQKELISLMQTDIKVAERNLKKIDTTLTDYSQKIMNLTTADAALAGIYTIQISQNQTQSQELQATISALKAKVYSLKLMMTPLRIKKTHIIGEMEVLDTPVRPKKALIIVISFIAGLLFSIFLVFFLNFIAEITRTEKKK